MDAKFTRKEIKHLQLKGYIKWDKNEYERFVVAITEYGWNDVDNISKYIGTRTTEQVIMKQKILLKNHPVPYHQKLINAIVDCGPLLVTVLKEVFPEKAFKVKKMKEEKPAGRYLPKRARVKAKASAAGALSPEVQQ